MTPLDWLLYGFFAIVGYMLLAAIAFVWIDDHSDRGMSAWYAMSPYGWCRFLIWALWPVVVIVFVMSKYR